MRTALLLALALLARVAHGQSESQVRELETKALEASGHGRHAEAASAYRKALELDPESESLRFRLAAEMAYSKHFTGAEEIFRSLAQSSNPEMAALARNSLVGIERDRRLMAAGQLTPEEIARRKAYFTRVAELRAREADLRRRQAIYDLFAKGETDRGLEALDKYGRGHAVPEDLRFAAVYALQRDQRWTEAELALERFPEAERTVRWKFLMGELQKAQGNDAEAYRLLWEVKETGLPDLAATAQEEIETLPDQVNLERWAWGEFQADYVYLNRFDDSIFAAQIREGTYVPGARWIQPFIQLDMIMDTKSGVSGLSQVFSDNLAGGHLGLRLKPFPREYMFAYTLLGVQKDLRGTTRFRGAWFLDWQAGVRLYKGIGPGTRFLSAAELSEQPALGLPWISLRWDPFLEGGTDGSYYSRYLNFIDYFQIRAGLRFLQVRDLQAWDVYGLEYGAFDAIGLYYNNFSETGLGLRIVTRLAGGLSVISRTEYLGGVYLGRNSENSRGTLPATYRDFRVTVSLWATW